jgi:uncharacterized Tic20 family protein
VHLAGGVLAVVGLAANLVPLLALVPSLVLFLASRSTPGWRRDEAREALNFQITWVAVMLLLQGVAVAVALLLSGQGLRGLALGFFTVRTRRGGGFHYPLRLDLVK